MSEAVNFKMTITIGNLRQQIAKERAELKARRDAAWIELKQKGWSNVKIAKRYGVSESTVRRALK